MAYDWPNATSGSDSPRMCATPWVVQRISARYVPAPTAVPSDPVCPGADMAAP